MTGTRIQQTIVMFAALLLAACDTQPPIFIEVSTVTDTDIADASHEVRATVRDENGIASMRLFFVVDEVAHIVPMSRIAEGSDGQLPLTDGSVVERPRFRAFISGQKIGTEVTWGLEACDTRGNCALAPPVYPAHAYRFVVGLLPSRPALDRITPDHAPASGGTRVVLDGEDFREGAIVFFGDTEAPHVEWVRGDRLVVESPVHPEGIVDVTVVNPDGESSTLTDAFTFTPAPVLSSVAPSSGPTVGGTAVTLTGSGFLDGVRALFDGVPCRNPLRVDETLLFCETPPGRAGPVDVEIVAEDGASTRVSGAFVYIPPPVVDGVSPDRGPDLGGTVIDIVGSDFVEGSIVLVDGQPCAMQVVIDANNITCITSPGASGIVDVTVVNPDGQFDVLIGGFNYLGPPLVVLVIPDEGPHAGGTEVRIIGAGFSDDMEVRFAGVLAEVLDVNDGLEIIAIVPPSSIPIAPAPLTGALSVDVSVQNLDPADLRSDVLENGFAYLWPPEVFEVIPSEGPTTGGTQVSIIGRFFNEMDGGAFAVFFGEAACINVVVVSSTLITCTTPPGPDGFVDVSVENHPDSRGTLENGFLYIPPPIVIDVIPGEGPTFGDERVRIIGENFRPGAIVFFDGLLCTDVTFISSTELECSTPPHEAGFVDVRVVNPDGQEDTGESLYRYLPVVVIPDFGLEAGFTRVRILAGGMQPGVIIRFGNTIATSCQYISDREVICQTPATTTPGPVEVSFLNPNGTGDSAEAGFTYRRYADRTAGRLDGDGRHANDVVVVDIDGDGDLDIAVANGVSGGGIQEADHLHRNNGAGTFTRTSFPGPQRISNSVDVGEVNDDGRPDIVFGISEDGGALLHRNDGNGQFTLLTTPQASFGQVRGAFDAQLDDFVGDGRDDLLILSIGCSNNFNNPELCDEFATGADGLFERTGNPTWVDRSSLFPHELGYVHDHKIAAVDLDGDGAKDVVLFVDNFNFPGFANEHRVLYNRVASGQGFVEDKSPFVGLVGDVFGVDFGDIDGDGDADIIGGGCHPPFESSEIVYSNVNGTLVRNFSALPIAVDDCNFGVHLFDADHDGDLDLAFSGERNGQFIMKMYVNRGDGTFIESPLSVPTFPAAVLATQGTGVASGDLDGDDDPDLVLTSTGGASGALRLLILE
jgi:hypothetical protein